MERDSMVVLGARAQGLSHRLCPPGPPGRRLWALPQAVDRRDSPPAGNQIRRRHLVRPTGRRERAPPATLQGRWGLSPSRASRPTKH